MENKPTTWEERRELEKQENKARYDKIRAHFDDVARELGPDWRQEPEHEENAKSFNPSPLGELSGPGEIKLWYRVDTYGAGRYKKVKLSGIYPRDAKGQYIDVYEYDEKHNRIQPPAISCAVDKEARLIARDISRRLLPAYLARLEKVKKQIADNDDYETRTTAALVKLKGFDLSEYERERRAVNIDGRKLPGQDYNSRAHIKASEEDITLELYNIDPVTALAVLYLIRE